MHSLIHGAFTLFAGTAVNPVSLNLSTVLPEQLPQNVTFSSISLVGTLTTNSLVFVISS